MICSCKHCGVEREEYDYHCCAWALADAVPDLECEISMLRDRIKELETERHAG